MKVYAVVSNDRAARGTHRLVVLLRRVGATVGFLIGFGLLALVMANSAGADAGADVQQGAAAAPDGVDGARLDSSLVDGATAVTDLLSPAAEGAGTMIEPVAPVVHAGAELLEPVVRPVADAVAPITAPVIGPVVSAVMPVVDTVTPVTEPLVGSLSRAAEPVVEPVSAAVGADDAVDAVAGEPDTSTPRGRQPVSRSSPQPGPAHSWAGMVTVSAPPGVASDVADRPDTLLDTLLDTPGWQPVHAGALAADAAAVLGSGEPGDRPGLPIGPGSATTGGAAAAGGPGGTQGAANAVLASASSMGHDDSRGRSPPGSIVGLPWFGFDDRDYPS